MGRLGPGPPLIVPYHTMRSRKTLLRLPMCFSVKSTPARLRHLARYEEVVLRLKVLLLKLTRKMSLHSFKTKVWRSHLQEATMSRSGIAKSWSSSTMSRKAIDLQRRSGLISCLTRCLQLSHLAVTGVSPTKSALKVYSILDCCFAKSTAGTRGLLLS